MTVTKPSESLEPGQVLATKLAVPWQINIVDDTIFYLSVRSGKIVSVMEGSTQIQSV